MIPHPHHSLQSSLSPFPHYALTLTYLVPLLRGQTAHRNNPHPSQLEPPVLASLPHLRRHLPLPTQRHHRRRSRLLGAAAARPHSLARSRRPSQRRQRPRHSLQYRRPSTLHRQLLAVGRKAIHPSPLPLPADNRAAGAASCREQAGARPPLHAGDGGAGAV